MSEHQDQQSHQESQSQDRPQTSGGGTSPTGVPPATDSQSGAATQSLLRLWLRVGGWLVACIGVLTIIAALRLCFRDHWPFLIVMGLLLMGASYVLAGLAYSEGRAWPIPLAILACVTFSPFSWGFSILLLIGIAALSIGALSEKAMIEGTGDGAQLAFGLWVVGLVVMLLYGVLQL